MIFPDADKKTAKPPKVNLIYMRKLTPNKNIFHLSLKKKIVLTELTDTHKEIKNNKQTSDAIIKNYFQNFEPVAVPVRDHGKFFTGDSYIVLKVSSSIMIWFDGDKLIFFVKLSLTY